MPSNKWLHDYLAAHTAQERKWKVEERSWNRGFATTVATITALTALAFYANVTIVGNEFDTASTKAKQIRNVDSQLDYAVYSLRDAINMYRLVYNYNPQLVGNSGFAMPETDRSKSQIAKALQELPLWLDGREALEGMINEAYSQIPDNPKTLESLQKPYDILMDAKSKLFKAELGVRNAAINYLLFVNTAMIVGIGYFALIAGEKLTNAFSGLYRRLEQ